MLSAIFRSLPTSPTTVTLVTQDKYESRLQACRGNGILMYSPKSVSRGFFPGGNDTYDIIIPRPLNESVNEAYSLYRSSNENEALEMFTTYSGVIPYFVKLTKKCSVASLQEVCDTVRNHRTWSISHLLAHLDKFLYFEDPEIQNHINDVEPLNGMTPIMVAIAAGKLATVQALLSLQCDLDILAHNYCSVLHFAASTSKDILNCLLSKEAARRWVNSFNGDGHTPLHLACLADKPDCVTALIISGANANVSVQQGTGEASPVDVSGILQSNTLKFSRDDMKYGGTPLHWCLSKEVIEALLDANCNINSLNLKGQTALHLMVLRNRLDCAVTLLYHGANPSIGDYDGNRPLHIAVKNTYINILQALVVFGADVNCLNKKQESPRHLVFDIKSGADKMAYMLHVSGARRCTRDIGGCSIICSHDGDFDGTPDMCVPRPQASSVLEHMLTVAGMERASIEKRPLQGGRLLCLDGGGIRGLILIQILLELEAASKRPIIQCFDWVAGTSTGGILALAMAIGKSLKECQMLYFKLKDQAFIGERPYSSDGIEQILKDAIGPTKKMSEIKNPKLMITGVLASEKPMKLCIFRNYSSPTEIITNLNEKSLASMTDHYVWEVARSTSAAPSYFKSFKSYVDGGLIANNPTLDALTEIIEHKLAIRASGSHESAESVSLVVSCGTGLVPVSKMQSLDVSWSRGIWETIRMASRLVELGTLLVDLATCTDGRIVDRARAWCSMAGIPYYRFNPQMSKDVPMDETNNNVIIQILWETKAYMFQNRSTVLELAEFLQRE